MKKVIKTIALITIMCMTATSCQKESIVEPQGTVADVSLKTVYYTVDGITSQASFVSEESWNRFLDWLITLAEEGHRVSFRNANQERGIKKDVVTYTTKDRDAAYEWASQMGNDGYEVFINYDKTTGVYTCVASK